jgi:hypothetical protein
VFRDSHGVVHTVSSSDPLRDLPEGAAAALSSALLRPGEVALEDALERCEAVRDLVERWQDAFFAALPVEVDLEEEARWAAEVGITLAEVEAGYDDDEDDDDDDEPDDEDPDEEPEPVAPALLEDLGLALGLEPEASDELVALLPEDLVAVLERELLLLPMRVRLEALVAAAALVATWADLLADHEKLLGHLVLAHGEPGTAGAHEALADRHAGLHAAAGPGHGTTD